MMMQGEQENRIRKWLKVHLSFLEEDSHRCGISQALGESDLVILP